jgi:hypothetical protein
MSLLQAHTNCDTHQMHSDPHIAMHKAQDLSKGRMWSKDLEVVVVLRSLATWNDDGRVVRAWTLRLAVGRNKRHMAEGDLEIVVAG